MKLIFLGPPGAGKGTIASKICENLGIPHISTGDLFRKAIKNQTELGKKVQQIIESGDLVPDALTVALVKERLNNPDVEKGYILDGFPRTIGQADSLSEFSSIDAVINFTITDDQVIKRLAGRRLCKNCGAGYHVDTVKPKEEGICDKCGGELIIRPDDAPEAIKNRLAVYYESTEPLIDYYRQKGILNDVDGSPEVAAVVKDTETTISAI
ncbi:MAG: adenylate kinase [Spirochaetales bacterium]|uniref:Adenylate kinase n=1 Tax=Candidatus Thalassospirochaeta sargassi TaxID=3119039 RepID=A0AAJ1MLA1_9SPIO|nr:adenylate kinase [Spirochaetales bacterium]